MQILVADDDPVSRYAVSGLLRKCGHEVVLAGNGSEALAVLQAESTPSVAILDWMMPGMDGVEVCRRVRALPDRRYVYLIALTAKKDEQDLVEALEAGFDDFLSKPVRLPELKARLLAGRRIVELQERLVLSCEVMKFKASHDPLTGMWNRAAIIELLDTQIARSRREQTHLALLMLDIDHFKNINDTYGHMVGDQILKRVAQTLTFSARAYDWLGRYGGEEFLVIAPDCPPAGAATLAERLREKIAGRPFTLDALQVPVTISLGLANLQDGWGNAFELLRAADTAVYQAKQNGRNRLETCACLPEREGTHGRASNPTRMASRAKPAPPAKPEGRVSWSAVQLPPFSPVAAKVLQLASKGDVSLLQLADLICSDSAFGSEIIAIVNSALYNLARPVTSIQQAVSFLGLERVKSLAVMVGVRTFLGPSEKDPAVKACWTHSLACAIIASEVASSGSLESETAYTGGIMHDIGRVALSVVHPQQYAQFLLQPHENVQEILQQERGWFEVDHCEAGANLVRAWELPQEFADITSRHHLSGQGRSNLLAIIHWSCEMANTAGFAAVPCRSLRDYEKLIGELPDGARSSFNYKTNELAAMIVAKIDTITSTR